MIAWHESDVRSKIDFDRPVVNARDETAAAHWPREGPWIITQGDPIAVHLFDLCLPDRRGPGCGKAIDREGPARRRPGTRAEGNDMVPVDHLGDRSMNLGEFVDRRQDGDDSRKEEAEFVNDLKPLAARWISVAAAAHLTIQSNRTG